MPPDKPAPPQALSTTALESVEKSRREMLYKAACTLLEWNRPLEEIAEITGLSVEEIEALRG